MELWDIYDNNRNHTGRTHVRGDPLTKGDYHIVVLVWIVNHFGHILLTKRHPDKHWPNMWECTGGCVIAGEDSLSGAIREAKEEIGLLLDPSLGRLIKNYIGMDTIYDAWLFIEDVDLNHVRFQPGEITDAMFVNKALLQSMFDKNQIVPTLEFILELIETDRELNGLVK